MFPTSGIISRDTASGAGALDKKLSWREGSVALFSKLHYSLLSRLISPQETGSCRKPVEGQQSDRELQQVISSHSKSIDIKRVAPGWYPLGEDCAVCFEACCFELKDAHACSMKRRSHRRPCACPRRRQAAPFLGFVGVAWILHASEACKTQRPSQAQAAFVQFHADLLL